MNYFLITEYNTLIRVREITEEEVNKLREFTRVALKGGFSSSLVFGRISKEYKIFKSIVKVPSCKGVDFAKELYLKTKKKNEK